MIKEIKCQVCGEVIGTLVKPEVTQLDEDLYRAMVTCPNGHTEAVLTPPEE